MCGTVILSCSAQTGLEHQYIERGNEDRYKACQKVEYESGS